MKYPVHLRIIHWLMAIVLIGMLTTGWFMEDLPDDIKRTVYGLHKSLGVTILFLLVLRFVVRISARVPELPPAIPPLERMTAKTVQWFFYIMMLAQPLSGYVMSNTKGYPVQWFGITMPTIAQKDEALNALSGDAHTALAVVFLALVAAHVGGVMVHHVRDKIPLLRRMI